MSSDDAFERDQRGITRAGGDGINRGFLGLDDYRPAELVSLISTNLTLLPGDVILTGTTSGVGPIQSGDKLEVRIQGLAPLNNSVR